MKFNPVLYKSLAAFFISCGCFTSLFGTGTGMAAKREKMECIQKAGLMPLLRAFAHDPLIFTRLHLLAFYAPRQILGGGQCVELFDGSQWIVNRSDREMVQKWSQTDTVFIKPTACCLSSNSYVLYNQTLHEVARVNFSSLPKNYQRFTQRVVKIDYYERLVQLDDPEGTVWKINDGDYYFSQWEYGNYLIVGVNNNWRNATYPHILINASIEGTPYSEAAFHDYNITINQLRSEYQPCSTYPD